MSNKSNKRQKVEVPKDPFRALEKKYKAYKNVETDFSDVIDFSNPNVVENKNVIPVENNFGFKIFTLKNVEGLYFIENPFTPEEQQYWVNEAVHNYTQPPNVSNLDMFHGPQKNLFDTFAEKGSTKGKDSMFCKLRWVTLGYHYNWTERTYNDQNYTQFPTKLGELSRKFSSFVGFDKFEPEAAIINFYQTDSTLCGHLDNVEETFDMPIVSISFGNTAVFLIGGQTKDVEPVPMFVRSGDVVIMSGHSRTCYHGVPRILNNTVPDKIFEGNQLIQQYIKNARINMNVRQVYKSPKPKPETKENLTNT